MAQYMILIYENESSYVDPTPEVWQQAMEAHGRFAGQVGEKGGKILGGDAAITGTGLRGHGCALLSCACSAVLAQPPEVSITGRTSTPPYGAGHSLAMSRAWSRSRASIR